MSRNRRRSSQTGRIGWETTVPEDIGPGDLLPWGVVREKTWGGPVGIDAWRVVVNGHHRPLWLKAKREVMCRRAFERADAAKVAGIVASDPRRASAFGGGVRHYVLRHPRLRRARPI
jgi:hypothetical protein